MFNIIAPFTTEAIYQNLKEAFKLEEPSITFYKWPNYDQKQINKSLEEEMITVKEILRLTLAERETHKIGLKWPLKKATISLPKEKITKIKKFNNLIKSQTNIKEIDFKEAKELAIKLDTKLTKELEQEGFFREVTRKIQALRKKAKLSKIDEISLVIDSDYGLDKFEDEIKARVGAINLSFGSLDGNYDATSEEKIKQKIFKIAFNKL